MQHSRRGFTLIELLIVISILVILAILVVSVYSSNQGTDRMRAGSRQLQSAILGARDRAIHAKAPRGLRFIVDSNDTSTVASFVYLGTLDPWKGKVTLGRADANGDGSADDNNNGTMDGSENEIRTMRGTNTGWLELARAGFLIDGLSCRIPKGGSLYTIRIAPLKGPNGILEPTGTPTASSDDVDDVLGLGFEFRGTASLLWPQRNAFASPHDIEIELGPTVLQGEQPITLPSNCIIDLDNSRLPGGWWTGTAYSTHMDVMFSPRGIVSGPPATAAAGIIHFLLAETGDTTIKIPGDAATAKSSSLHKSRATSRTIPPEATQGEKLIVTLFTRTGAVSTHPVDVISSLGTDGKAGAATTDDDSDGTADEDAATKLPDPEEIGYGDDNPRERFRFAETGMSAGK